ncbi:MAG TPA: MgtC/SapB family protein [Candidatus Hydrogenedentes bacterium]|nr:MgtC/SapB family protein [Candidatus Hydrogenedentota bacterium]
MGALDYLHHSWERLIDVLEPWGLATLPEVCLKFGLAVVLAGIVGVERERKGRGAGLRTHVLVCLGATLMMVVADLLARAWNAAGSPVWLDSGRIAAGIITGIGFLGAGTIMTVGGTQRGLTTAAMIWFVAGLGIAVGAGYYVVAVSATLIALAVVLFFGFVEVLIPSAERYALSIRLPAGLREVGEIQELIHEKGYRVRESRLKVVSDTGKVDMTFEISTRQRLNPAKLVESLHDQLESVERIVLEK